MDEKLTVLGTMIPPSLGTPTQSRQVRLHCIFSPREGTRKSYCIFHYLHSYQSLRYKILRHHLGRQLPTVIPKQQQRT